MNVDLFGKARYLRDFEHGSGISIEKGGNWEDEKWIHEMAVKISNNAVAAYRLIRRYGKILPRLIENIKKEFGEDISRFLINFQ